MRESLTAVNKTSGEQYSACVTDFLNAARLVRQAKNDLNDISKRLAYVDLCLLPPFLKYIKSWEFTNRQAV